MLDITTMSNTMPWTQEKRAIFAGEILHAIQTPTWSSTQKSAVESALLQIDAIELLDWPEIKEIIYAAVDGASKEVAQEDGEKDRLCVCLIA